ncbi:MAG: hypothetical protein D6748_08685 [Calditrichaeota bacterium]|nr:MAG: hypothetical protein D6748_08685 [Calditrichota bacterium]
MCYAQQFPRFFLIILVLTVLQCSRNPISDGNNQDGEPVRNRWELRGTPAPSAILTLISDSSGNYYGGTENEGIFISADSGKTWEPVNQGLPDLSIAQVLIDRFGHLFTATTHHGVYRWNKSDSIWEAATPADTSAWALLALEDGTLLAGMSNGLFRSMNWGLTWEKLGDTTITEPVLSLTIGENNLLLAGTYGDGLYASQDFGATWQKTGLELGVINTVMIDSRDRIFAGLLGGGALRSTGNLLVWESLSNSLNSNIINKFVETSGAVLFAATHGSGVFSSTDGGEHWEVFNTDLTDRVVTAMMLDARGHLVVGTDSGQVFRTLLSISEPWLPPDFGDE